MCLFSSANNVSVDIVDASHRTLGETRLLHAKFRHGGHCATTFRQGHLLSGFPPTGSPDAVLRSYYTYSTRRLKGQQIPVGSSDVPGKQLDDDGQKQQLFHASSSSSHQPVAQPRKKAEKRARVHLRGLRACRYTGSGWRGLCSTRHPGLSLSLGRLPRGGAGALGRVAAALDMTWPGGALCGRSEARNVSLWALRFAKVDEFAYSSPFLVVASAMVAGSAWLPRERWPGIVQDESSHGRRRCVFSSGPPIRHWSGCSQCRQMATLHPIPRCGTLKKSSVAIGDGRVLPRRWKLRGLPGCEAQWGMRNGRGCWARSSGNLIWPELWSLAWGTSSLLTHQTTLEPRETVPWTASDSGRFPGAKTATVAWC